MMAHASSANRKKVGAVVVTPSMAVFTGYNGTHPGAQNSCEDLNNRTLDTVYHAEENALDKMLMEGVRAKDSVLYLTMSPCINCAKRIAGSGVAMVSYLEKYRCDEGVNYLKSRGVGVSSWSDLLGEYFSPIKFDENL